MGKALCSIERSYRHTIKKLEICRSELIILKDKVDFLSHLSTMFLCWFDTLFELDSVLPSKLNNIKYHSCLLFIFTFVKSVDICCTRWFCHWLDDGEVHDDDSSILHRNIAERCISNFLVWFHKWLVYMR